MGKLIARCDVCNKKIGECEDGIIYLWCPRCKEAHPVELSEFDRVTMRLKGLESFIETATLSI